MLGRWDTWVFHRDSRGEWRWTRYADAEVVGKSTEGYHHRRDAESNATRLGWKLSAWPTTNRRDHWEFYRDRAGLWRWRRQARNGRIVAASHVGFSQLDVAQQNAKRFGWLLPSSGGVVSPVSGGGGVAAALAGEWKTCTG
jgi:uncharacterized protein YegP (UPF0339 family)